MSQGKWLFLWELRAVNEGFWKQSQAIPGSEELWLLLCLVSVLNWTLCSWQDILALKAFWRQATGIPSGIAVSRWPRRQKAQTHRCSLSTRHVQLLRHCSGAMINLYIISRVFSMVYVCITSFGYFLLLQYIVSAVIFCIVLLPHPNAANLFTQRVTLLKKKKKYPAYSNSEERPLLCSVKTN